MKNWKVLPKIEHVSKYVECYWCLEKEPHDRSFNYPRLNPHPSSHLIIANLNRTYEYTHGASSQRVMGTHWVFPHLKTLTMDHSDPFRIIGVKFKVGALYSLNFSTVRTNLDRVEMIDVNHPIYMGELASELLLMRATEQKGQVCNILDKALLPWLLDSHEDRHSQLVRQVFPLLGNVPIADMGDQLHRSQRTVERSFMRVTGLSMKQVQSMFHLEEMLNYLYQQNEESINWAHLANMYGFSDQSHLIRYLKSSIGETPTHYAKHRDLTIDIYGNFECS